MSRIRQKQSSYIRRTVAGITVTEQSNLDTIEVMNDVIGNFKGYNNVTHLKCLEPFSGLYSTNYGSNPISRVYWIGRHDTANAENYYRTALQQYLSSVVFPLGFQQNNNFELLALIAELDDLLATFTLAFWRSITFGAVNWSLAPLVSDIMSIYSTLRDFWEGRFQKDLESLQKPVHYDLRSVSFQTTYGISSTFANVLLDGSARFAGSLSIKTTNRTLDSLAILLDELGVHPDLRTVWDLIPLSFVLDYFLPIGDAIESIHPRGWFNPVVTFRGNFSFNGNLTLDYPSRSGTVELTQRTFKYKCYSRGPITIGAGTRVLESPEFTCPSLRELFNTSYLAFWHKLERKLIRYIQRKNGPRRRR